MSDATRAAAAVLAAVPINAALELTVLRAAGGHAEVALAGGPAWARVDGAAQGAALAALVDAAGLAALVSGVVAPARFADEVSALGTHATLAFLRLARGPVTARCGLDAGTLGALVALSGAGGPGAKVRLDTDVEIVDARGAPVCRGRFSWSLRRR
ncbi:MAG TPA: hypothetical protein VI318_22445 [Baekduia sp.]